MVAGVEGTNGSFVNVDGADESVGVAATVSTASSSRTTISSGGGKRSSGASTGGGLKKEKQGILTAIADRQEVTIKC